MAGSGRVTAVLGPTNTGKTHYAIERMLGHRSGVIGLPLRLLAREVYDRIVALRGPSVVALITGEERIVPQRVAYWVCTVEAMPLGLGADFVAIDEIQLCADPDRGHVFTDRLLNARGRHETLLLGADTMRGAIAALVPGVAFVSRPRLSELGYAGAKKISRLPERAAIVGFSGESVYAIAELIRRQKGGCAVVMGALSPRTRNAQVALYQNGDVDYLVATDAIGMGLNLDVRHVAFSSTAKFDGRRMRPLIPNELAQIAGRAGRHLNPGTFGVTGEARPLPPELVEAIEQHRFAPVTKLHWRNADLDFASPARLIASLEAFTHHDWLTRVREADDLRALKALVDLPEVRDAVAGPREVRRLWDIASVPDFRGISPAEHAGLLARLFGFLHAGGVVPPDWLAPQIARLDRSDGDIDTLSRRLAFIRTWTYVAQREGWVADENHWRGETRAVEDRLSDALHARLTQRFVDRRTSILMRRLKQRESLVAEVNDKGEVTVEGEFVGRIEGFRFRTDEGATSDEARTLRAAAEASLRPHFHLRADRFYNAPDPEMDFTDQGGLMWGTTAVGRLVAGPDAMRPQVAAFVDESAGEEVAEKVRRRLQHFIDRKVAALFEPLIALGRDEALPPLARGFAFRLSEHFGLIAREGVAEEVRALDQAARGSLRRHGVRFGQYTVFLPALLKPAPTRLRLVLWSLAYGLDDFPASPPPGLVTIPHLPGVPAEHYLLGGYRPAGARAIRIDMLERLADLVRAQDRRAGFEASADMLSISGLTLEQFAELMAGIGYRAERGERAKQRPQPRPEAQPETPPEAGGESASGAGAGEDGQTRPDAAAATAPAPEPMAETVTEPAPARKKPLAAEAPATPAPHAETAPEPAAQPACGPEATPPEPTPPEATPPETDATPPETDATPATAAEAGAAAEATEVFFTFRWAPARPRGGRGHRTGDRHDAGTEAEREGQHESRRGKGGGPRRDDRPEGVKPAEDGNKPPARSDGGKGTGTGKRKGGKPRDARKQRDGGSGEAPRRTYESHPPRADRIDPDNPFAVLAALRNRT